MPRCRKSSEQCRFCPTFETGLFSGLPAGDLERLEQCKTVKDYKRKQSLFSEGDPVAGLYCIRSGKVKLSKIGMGGKQQILKIAEPGEILGPAALFAQTPHEAAAEAIEDSSVCFVERAGFLPILRANISVALRLIAQLSREITKSHQKTYDLAYKSVRMRLAEFLLELERSFGIYEEGGGSRLGIVLTREELAQAVGATVETTVRLLSEFRSEGLLKMEKKSIRVLQPEKLRAFTRPGY